jgi:hypothetical protein
MASHRFDYSEVYARMSDLDDVKYDFLILPLTPGPAIKKNPNHDQIRVDKTLINYWDFFH